MFLNLNIAVPKAVIWDWDGTIVSSYELIRYAMEDCCSFFEVLSELRKLSDEHVGRTALKEFFPLVFGDKWHLARDRFYKIIEDCHLEKTSLIDGAREVLMYISNQHPEVYMAIVSNKRGDVLRKEVQHLGLLGCFRSIIGAGDAPQDKPSVEPLQLALRAGGISPGPDVYIIGDSVTDIELAVNGNCKAIFYDDGSIDLSTTYNTALIATIKNYQTILYNCPYSAPPI